MKKFLFAPAIILCCAMIGQTAWAGGVQHVAFYEAFNSNEGSGGRDGQFGGKIATSKPLFDRDGWSYNQYIKGASECIRFGTNSENGVLTTPEIVLLGKQATLTFMAAGWSGGDTNRLNITANEGVTLNGQTIIMLQNGAHFEYYQVDITLTTATYVQLTFTGKRGFLDDVMVEETVTAINAPTLTDEHLFWPNTTETPTTNITLVPSDSTTVYYTTDGSEPSTTNGHIATLTTNFKITGTTTVKAKAYYGSVASDMVSKTYTVGETVNSIAAFKELEEGSEVRLFIADDDNARVLHGADGKMFLRDDTGTLCMDFGTTATFNPAPQHNQHVAGWIVGKKQTADGLLKLVATGNTNTNYLALAAPIREQDVSPVRIDRNTDINEYIGNWVMADDLRNGTALNIQEVYDGALVDVSGIVTGEYNILPVDYADIKPVVYVIDEGEAFVSPDADIDQVTVRLKRTLKANQWNTFCVPFSIDNLDANIREYDFIDGTTMKFKEAASIQAGKPYLVMPDSDIKDPVYSNVTLSAQPALSIEYGGYSFEGIYSPTELLTDKTQLFLTNSGQLAYPASLATATMKGMRAYFQVPVGANARLYIDDTEDSLQPLSGSPEGERVVYDLSGRLVNSLKKGIYVVNGKKLLVR